MTTKELFELAEYWNFYADDEIKNDEIRVIVKDQWGNAIRVTGYEIDAEGYPILLLDNKGT